MLNNHFVKRYKSIPIARYAHLSRENSAPDMITNPEIHKEFEMILIEEGEVIINVNNTSLTAKAGDLFFISPYMLHSLTLPPQGTFRHICFCFDLSLLSDPSLEKDLVDNHFFITQLIEASSLHNAFLKNKFLDIDDAVNKGFPYWELTVRGSISLMFSYLMQNNLKESAFSTFSDKDFCIRTFKYIEAHYSEKINSGDAASALCYNQSYFCRIFKKNFSMSFGEYLNMYRLEKSKFFLKNPALSVTDVAFETGFLSLSYFTKLFRLQCGITPNKFREIYVKKRD